MKPPPAFLRPTHQKIEAKMRLSRTSRLAACTVFAVIATGCTTPGSTSSAKAGEFGGQTQFEALRDKLTAKIKGAVPQTVEGSSVSLRVRAPNGATRTLDTAASDFAQWCGLHGGKLYVATDPNKPGAVITAERLSDLLGRTAGLETNYFTRSCEVQDDTHVLLGEHVSLGVGGYPMEIRYDGFTVAWLSAQELKAKGPAATAEAERKRAVAVVSEAAEKKRREQESRADEQMRREATARKLGVLQRSAKGTQFVCTGRQGSGQSIADIWYRCSGQNFGIVTLAEFSENGWRVSSQTLVPVLMTSGNVEHNATVVFEKVK